MKIVLAMRYVDRDGKRLLQQRLGDLVAAETDVMCEPYLTLTGDPVWEDVPFELG